MQARLLVMLCKHRMTIQTLYAANDSVILAVSNNRKTLIARLLSVSNNRKLLIIRLLPVFTGVHGSEREHLRCFRAFQGVLSAVLGDIDRCLTGSHNYSNPSFAASTNFCSAASFFIMMLFPLTAIRLSCIKSWVTLNHVSYDTAA
jgi:hypothetical protein